VGHQAFPNLHKWVPALEHAGPGAVLWLGLNGPASRTFQAILAFAILIIVVYVLKPVARALGTCWAKRIEVKLAPPVPPNPASPTRRRRRRPKSPLPQRGTPARPP
jgi:hypothetical protein